MENYRNLSSDDIEERQSANNYLLGLIDREEAWQISNVTHISIAEDDHRQRRPQLPIPRRTHPLPEDRQRPLLARPAIQNTPEIVPHPSTQPRLRSPTTKGHHRQAGFLLRAHLHPSHPRVQSRSDLWNSGIHEAIAIESKDRADHPREDPLRDEGNQQDKPWSQDTNPIGITQEQRPPRTNLLLRTLNQRGAVHTQRARHSLILGQIQFRPHEIYKFDRPAA